MDYRRIKYISRFANDLEPREVASIGEQSRRNNLELGITGLLIASGGVFMQILEGPPDPVGQIWARISADARHRDVLLLADEPSDHRLFPEWAMKTIDLRSSASTRLGLVHSLLNSINAQRGLIDTLVSAIERAVWDEYVERGSGESPGG